MGATVFLLTPPFTQLNTPYPATAYLKGFLHTRNISAAQADLGIEVITALFSKEGLTNVFQTIQNQNNTPSDNIRRIVALKDDYIHTIDEVMSFLRGHNPTLAHLISQEDFLPEAGRFDQLADMETAFGDMGTQDKAKHLATLYLEDLSDLISQCIDEHFGFSRYAERLGRSANTFDELYNALHQPFTYIDELLIKILQDHIARVSPKLVCITVPFPGNLYSAFRCAQWVKTHHPHIKTAMGGGFANTELRSLSEPRVFEFFDFITLDDGEAPIEHLVEHIEGRRPLELLKRAFALINGKVEYLNLSLNRDYKQAETGTPDYSGLPLDQYISVLEIANPMHRLWSDGRWNKLTMAHGCYWGKCTFCDISLDYIKVYEPIAAKMLCDRMEELIAQTGQTGFHFVDEAAPPALMRALALEILNRKLTVSWWTNIRFEKSFTPDLCLLLKASGCIAVTGGLEVASDRLLQLIQKGVTVAQVARVARNFSEAGIMVHAYLMYGFPTQTAQETIDSLEMVRQMFEAGIVQSGFWHQFAMTAHSPVGLDPEKFGAVRLSPPDGPFANNDLIHSDPKGADHEKYSYGLKKSLLNYLNGICFEYPLQSWFDFKTPRTSVRPDYIFRALEEDEDSAVKPHSKLVWLGVIPEFAISTKNKKGRQIEQAQLTFYTKKETFVIKTDLAEGEWLCHTLPLLSPQADNLLSFKEIQESYAQSGLGNFESFWYGKAGDRLRKLGLLVL